MPLGATGDHVGEWRLPKTATQFELDLVAMPALYRFLDQLGATQPVRPGVASEANDE